MGIDGDVYKTHGYFLVPCNRRNHWKTKTTFKIWWRKVFFIYKEETLNITVRNLYYLFPDIRDALQLYKFLAFFAKTLNTSFGTQPTQVKSTHSILNFKTTSLDHSRGSPKFSNQNLRPIGQGVSAVESFWKRKEISKNEVLYSFKMFMSRASNKWMWVSEIKLNQAFMAVRISVSYLDHLP